MNRKLACALAVAVVAVPLGASANAAPPKGFTKTVDFTDATPDPSGNAESGNEMHCSGQLPQEDPIEVKLPGPGILDVSIAGFQGDWALQIQDKDGEVGAGDDQNPPAYEATSARFKKPMTVKILPCNMTGTPQAKVTYKYTFKK